MAIDQFLKNARTLTGPESDKISIHATAICLLTYPVLVLSVRDGMSVCLVVMLAASAWYLFCHPDLITWQRGDVAIILAMSSLVILTAVNEVYHKTYKLSELDGPSRFLLATPVYFSLRKMPTVVFRFLQYAFALGVTAGATTSALFPSPLGRFSGTYFLDAPMWADAMLALSFLVLCAIDWRKEPPAMIAFKIAVFFVGGYCVFRTGERGTWIAIPVLLFLWATYRFRTKHRVMILIIALLAAAAAYITIPSIPARLTASTGEMHNLLNGDFSGSIGQRLQIWRAALEAFRTHVLFGVGGEGVKPFFRDLGEHGWFTRDAFRSAMSQVHNEIIAHMMRLGAPGGLSILAIYLVPLAFFARGLRFRHTSARNASLMGTLFVTSYLIFGLSNETFNLKTLASFYALTVTVLLGFTHNVYLAGAGAAPPQPASSSLGQR